MRNWTVPSRFPPSPVPPQAPRGARLSPIGKGHAPWVSHIIRQHLGEHGWRVEVNKGRVVVIAVDHLEDRIKHALSKSMYYYTMFGNGTDVLFFHVQGKYDFLK